MKIVSDKRCGWELKLHAALWAYRVAYKTSIGTTPFNMVFGLEAILPMEFLIPTLRVTKELNWMGHKLSEWLEDLEKLDETCLAAVDGVYALKRQQRKFHDSHISIKEFKLGNLVLFFYSRTICFEVHKARMRTLCDLWAIIGLSSSGAIKLLTLDEEEMANWISVCRIKKYNTPLTTEEL